MRRSLLIMLAVLLLTPACAPAAPTAALSTKIETKVDIFVTDWCPYCRKIESFLKKNQIEYTRYDVEKDAAGAEIFAKLGGEGVPLVRVGKEVIHGYDPDAVLEALRA